MVRYKLNSNLEMDVVDGELVVLNPTRARFFYYTPATQNFLKLFENAASVEDLVELGTVPQGEVAVVNEFTTHLVTSGLLVAAPDAERPHRPAFLYERPVFISDGKERVDDFAYLNPVASGH